MKKNRTLKIGIVGCGGISRCHTDPYRQAGAHAALVFDINRGAAEALARETGAEVAGSLEAMTRPGVLDAVSVCTPPAFHLENCLPFLRAHIPVLCEKPLEVSLPQARRLADAARKSRTVFMTAYCHRFHPPILEAKKILQQNKLGTPLFFRNTFAGQFDIKGNHRADPKLSGGGCVADNCAHSVDLFRFLMGEVKSVQAQIAHLVQKTEVEDFGVLVLRGRDGCVGEIVSSYSLPGAINSVEVLCSNGTLTVHYWAAGRPDLSYRVAGEKEDHVVDVSKMPDRFTTEVRHFLDCVRSGKTPAITAADGLASAKIIAAAYASARTGKLVNVK